MPRKVTLKNPDHTIRIGGQEISGHNITPEIYDYLLSVAPGHADLFDVTDDTPVDVPKAAKPTVKSADAPTV